MLVHVKWDLILHWIVVFGIGFASCMSVHVHASNVGLEFPWQKVIYVLIQGHASLGHYMHGLDLTGTY